MPADVIVAGAGIIALSSAVALSDRGLKVRVVGTAHSGEASSAAAGMLTPSMEAELDDIRDLAIDSRDLYPAFLSDLNERTGVAVSLNRLGSLHLALSETEAETFQVRAQTRPELTWMSSSDLLAFEPDLTTSYGALYASDDGCVDALTLMEALRQLVANHRNIEVTTENVVGIATHENHVRIATDSGNTFSSKVLVLAAGAWSPSLLENGRHLPVIPVRGQIVAYKDSGTTLSHVTYGGSGYLVPRSPDSLIAGSTSEMVGFDHSVTEEGVSNIRSNSQRLLPSLRDVNTFHSWAGLRPVTPDMRPVIGTDPQDASLVYACGHSRNGILLAPLTAQLVADIVTGQKPRYDISQFRPERF